jgi:hypothetical protein
MAHVPRSFYEEMGQKLLEPISAGELKLALLDIAKEKSNRDLTNYGQKKSREIIFKMWIYQQNVDA